MFLNRNKLNRLWSTHIKKKNRERERSCMLLKIQRFQPHPKKVRTCEITSKSQTRVRRCVWFSIPVTRIRGQAPNRSISDKMCPVSSAWWPPKEDPSVRLSSSIPYLMLLLLLLESLALPFCTWNLPLMLMHNNMTPPTCSRAAAVHR